MNWYEIIVAAHLAVCKVVSHGQRLQSDRYFVWQEDGADALVADGVHSETAVTGTTDLFTKREFDPWKAAFETAMDASPYILWELNSIQFEPDTGFWHYEWVWSVM